MSAPLEMGPGAFQAWTGVSRETMERLTIYADLLTQWQQRLNLIGPKTLPILWQRHMLDSAQLFPLLPPRCRLLVDLGSGAGFPGLVLAAMGVPEVHLVESDGRKAAFLRETARAMGLSTTIHNCRVEAIDPFPADAITARALAPLSVLVDMSQRFTHKGTVLVFPKGKDQRREVTDARASRTMRGWTKRGWTIDVQAVPSQTDASAAVVLMTGLPAAFDQLAAPGALDDAATSSIEAATPDKM